MDLGKGGVGTKGVPGQLWNTNSIGAQTIKEQKSS